MEKGAAGVMHRMRNPQLMAVHACSGSFVHALRHHINVVLEYVDTALDETASTDPRRQDLLEARHAASEAAALLELKFT
jgi:hypothetical protein